MRAGRLLTPVGLLQARGTMTAEQLAVRTLLALTSRDVGFDVALAWEAREAARVPG